MLKSQTSRIGAAAQGLGLGLGVVLVLLSGCISSGPRDYENENDRLRISQMDDQKQIEGLGQEVAHLKGELDLNQKQLAALQQPLPDGLTRPDCRQILLASFSGGVDTDQDGADDAVRLYVATLDAQGRFVQVVGRMKVTAAVLKPGEEARTVATRTFEAREVDESYRSGLTGTHYTLLVPITGPVPDGTVQFTVRVGLEDLVTGQTHEGQKVLRWSGKTKTDQASKAQKP